MSLHRRLLLCIPLLMLGCQRVPDTIEPSVNYALQDKYLQSLPPAFPSASVETPPSQIEQEIRIGTRFAKELDLYRAITTFKRASFLLPTASDPSLAMQIDYHILFCYYMGKKWDDVLSTFGRSQLRNAEAPFPAFHDLLLILYEAYTKQGLAHQAEQILQVIAAHYPQEASQLRLSTALIEADLPTLEAAAETTTYLPPFLEQYQERKKSVGKAQLLNALLPGAGYLYLGQNQSAFTAFCLNGLFIAASVYFFKQDNIAAGAIFTSFEAGWYFGGIYGAGLEAKSYNEHLYESLATSLMMREKLFPGLMIRYGF